jgi:hypothetical protein
VLSKDVQDQAYVNRVAPSVSGLLDGETARSARTTSVTGGKGQRIERRRQEAGDRFMMCRDESEPRHDAWLRNVAA